MEDKIKKIMSKIFSLDVNQINKNTAINNVEKWDSLSHISLIISIENHFDLEFSSKETVKMISFKAILKTIQSNIENKK
jgi:acyl carrier protein